MIIAFPQTLAQHLTKVAVYVDNISLTSSDPAVIQDLNQSLNTAFDIKDLGFLHYFLGFEVTYHHDGVSLTQRKFTQDLLKESGHLHDKCHTTPYKLQTYP